jgi:hypothetical protein
MVEFFLMTQVRFERIRFLENKMIYLGTIYC